MTTMTMLQVNEIDKVLTNLSDMYPNHLEDLYSDYREELDVLERALDGTSLTSVDIELLRDLVEGIDSFIKFYSEHNFSFYDLA